MRAWVRAAVVMAVVQLGLVLAYRASRREAAPVGRLEVSWIEAPSPLPAWTLEGPDGAVVERGRAPRWRLVHFWATWCPPCRRELPGLLALARRGAIEVVVIATDPAWPDIERFFDGRVPPEIVRLRDHDALARLGTRALPESFLVSPGGDVVGRVVGERDWSAPAVLAELERIAGRAR